MSFTEKFLNELKAQLIHMHMDHVYLLVDPFLRAPREHEVLWQWLVEHPAKVVELPNEMIAAESYPLLIALDLRNDDHCAFAHTMIMEALEENQPNALLAGNGRRVCAFINSSVSIEQLARHLGRQAVLRKEGKAELLRYYDPMVWLDVWMALSPEQRQRLMGPMLQWWTLDHTPQWHIYTHPEQVPRISGRLWLRLPQWEWLERVGLTNRIINAHWQKTGEIPENARAKVRKALQNARLYGFENEQDLQAFGEHALAFGIEFDQHPMLQTLLAKRATGLEYLALISTISDQDWQCIGAARHGLNVLKIEG